MSCAEGAARSRQEKVVASQKPRQPVLLSKYENNPYMRDYERYRANFTPEQRARYEELLRGRRGVMREPEPGVCCERCLRDEPPPLEATEEEGEQPVALKGV